MITRETWAQQHWSRNPLIGCPKGQVMQGMLKGGDRPVSPEQPAQSKASGLFQTYKV